MRTFKNYILTEKAKSMGWKSYTNPDGTKPKELPKKLVELFKFTADYQLESGEVRPGFECNPFRYQGSFYSNCIIYKGDPETSTDWMILFNNGGAYKVGKRDALWHTRPHDKGGKREGYLYLACEYSSLLLKSIDAYHIY